MYGLGRDADLEDDDEVVETDEEVEDPFEAAGNQRSSSESPGLEKRPSGDATGKKRTLPRRKESSPKRSKVSSHGEELEFDLDSLQQASISDLIKKKLIKEILGTSSNDDKKPEEVSKTDAADLRISGTLRVTMANGTKFTVTLDEESPSSANIMARHLLRVPNCKPGNLNEINMFNIYITKIPCRKLVD